MTRTEYKRALDDLATAWTFPMGAAPPVGQLAEARQTVAQLAPALEYGGRREGNAKPQGRPIGQRTAGSHTLPQGG